MTSLVTRLPRTGAGARAPRAGQPRSPAPRSYAVAAYARALRAVDVQDRPQDGVDLLPGLVPGCRHASITTVSAHRVWVRVTTDATGRRVDELQGELDEGPCLQAARTGHSVVAQDLLTETRWPGWCAAADELGVTAVVSVLLSPRLRPPTTLNLYAGTTHALAGVDIALLHALARPLADALLELRHHAPLGPAA